MNEMIDKYEQKNPFSTPEGYFDSLEDRVMSRVRKIERSRHVGLSRALKPFVGWAALLVVVVLAVRWTMGVSLSGQSEGMAETQLDTDFNPTTEEILEYLSEEVDLAVLSNEILGK
jgi:hypothetical protein